MEEIVSGTIILDEVSQDAKQVKIVSDGKKFNFWIKKKDGASTKAYEAWCDMKPAVGDSIDVQYKEEEAEFTNEAGKLINFTRRTIMQIREAGTGGGEKRSPAKSAPAHVPSADGVTKAEFNDKIKEMSAAFMTMQGEIARIKGSIGLE